MEKRNWDSLKSIALTLVLFGVIVGAGFVLGW